MIFNSVEFLIFFIVVTSLYFALPQKGRWPMLLAASCLFYMFFKPIYIFILFFTIIIDYFVGIVLEQTEGPQLKKVILTASIVANVGVLAIFKYYNFLIGNLETLLKLTSYTHHLPYLEILLPIGLSFHTFQAMSYTIEVYKGNFKAERNLGIYSLYVMFYPQLVAGPIERPQNILPQLREYHRFSYSDFTNGMKLIFWGFFKKIVIADRLSEFVGLVYQNPTNYSSLSVIVACIFFSFQIYCDFSGYSDIAIGAARVMGIDLMKNFERPYLSQSISEFWSRWHISLSTWFRDYVYIPMGGNRVSKTRTYLNQMIVFLLSGLWHGANWTFVFWGALHGFFVISESIIKKYFSFNAAKNNIALVLMKRVWIFCIVSFAWIFFRASNFKNARDIIYTIRHPHLSDFAKPLFGAGYAYSLYLSIELIAFLMAFETVQSNRNYLDMVNGWPKAGRWGFILSLIVAILTLGAFHNSGEFIYFQF